MTLTFTKVQAEANALVDLSNRMTTLLFDVKQVLANNSNLAINWVPTTLTFTAANATETFTATAHGLVNGQKVRVTTSGTLPAGLLPDTDYFLVNVTANTFQLALTKGGAVVAITADGTGTQTLNPVPDYITEDSVSNISGFSFSRAAVLNVINSIDQFRKLMENLGTVQGDYLGNLNQLARPLG